MDCSPKENLRLELTGEQAAAGARPRFSNLFHVVQPGIALLILATMAGLLSVSPPCLAAPPQLTSIIPRGWKVGPNDVTVQGANFTEDTRLLLDLPAAVVAPKADVKPAPNQMQFVVTVAPQTPSGVYEASISSDDGVSVLLPIVIDPLPTVAEVEPNNVPLQAQLLTLPAGVEGRLTGPEADLFAFDGKQGQRLVVEFAGRRLGCNIKPVLRLLNTSLLELQAVLSSRRLGGDVRLIAVLPADGRYYLELHDLVYRGDNNQYRMLIGDLQVADHAFPLGGRRGTNLALTFFGGTLATPLPASALLDAAEIGDRLGVSMPGVAPPGGPVPSPLPAVLAIGDLDEVLEQPSPDGTPQQVPVPVVINGRLAQKGEHDKYHMAVTPGSKLRFRVQSEQLGTPLDGVLDLRNDQGAVLITQDDGPGTADPDLFFTVPANVTTLIVGLTDIHGRGGDPFVYRLAIEPAASGDFELLLLNPLLNIPAGGSASVRVRATRRDYAGPIRLKVAGDVPAGLTLSSAEIGAGTTDTLLSLSASAETPLKAGTLRIIGEGGLAGQPPITRVARLALQPLHDGLPWLRTRLPGAVARPGLLALDMEVTEPALLRGVEYTAKVKVRRTEGQTGPINLTVQTSQNPIPGQVQVAPVANLTIAENMAEGIIKITVPATAPEIPLAYVVTGQLLDVKDKKTVVASAESPSVSTSIAFPFALQVAPAPELKRGVRNLLSIKLTRLGKFNEPVQVALAGLPGTVRTGPVVVAPGISDVQIPLLIAPAQPGGALANLKLTATWATAPPLVTPPLDVPLAVGAADAGPALEIFDEGADFVASLTEGAGMAELETKDAFSGKESALVKPEQKFRSVLPGLGVAIAEAPTPGQYRYLRFAWKKKAGAGVMLQLANNGQFGVASSKGTDYRYVAGADKYNSKAIRIAEQPPQEWTVVTRDLFADHGAFTLTGLSLTPMDGEFALFDHIFVARSEADFPAPAAK